MLSPISHFAFTALFLIGVVIQPYAQGIPADTSLLLREVTIAASRLTSFSAGTKVISTDSITSADYTDADLAKFLAYESPLFIKNYGPGSIASSAFRGGSANHTAVLWNGFPLNNPMHGQTDLSLLPAGIFDQVTIQYGGVSAMWGSGALGGAILLNNHPSFDEGLSLKGLFSAGSFSSFNQQFHASLGKARMSTTLKLIHQSAENDFPFENTEHAVQKQTHAELESFHVLSESHFLLNEKQRLNINAWLQSTDRNIPPTIVQATNAASQYDETLRLTTQWDRYGKKNIIQARVAYFNEQIIYADPVARIRDTSHSQTLIAEGEMRILPKKGHQFNIGLNNTYTLGKAPGYPYRPDQHRIAAFASYAVQNNTGTLRTVISGRQEMVAANLSPFTWSIASELRLLQNLNLRGNIARVYRIPTFNDLYWEPGGNPDLLSEHGYAQEGGLHLQCPFKNLTLTSDISVFHKIVHHWILWVPGSIYWHPENILKVRSRGMETTHQLTYKSGSWKHSLSVSTNYVRSTTESTEKTEQALVGKQLTYLPVYSGMAKWSIAYRNISLTYRHQYTGYRYTSSDNTQYLSPFHVGTISAKYQHNSHRYHFTLQAEINNMWDMPYQVILHRAMPGRNGSVGIIIEFNHPNSST